MTTSIKAIRGMSDILPDKTPLWQSIETTLSRICNQYGYNEIRLPIVEQTALFKRSIGEVTDIIEKEMYTFPDRNDDSLSLRPEGTASCVRAALEHGLIHNQIQKLWYLGPMFRYERPQKGRYRQFYQFGVEAFGLPGPDIDVELILLTKRLWQALGVEKHINLEINSLGTQSERLTYRKTLINYFNEHKNALDDDSKRRLVTNPLRILDSKNEAMQDVTQHAPKLIDHLNAESRAHFDVLQEQLNENNVDFTVNPNLVRGLDYYSHTVFEWITDKLGAQGTVLAGGRYDALVETLGGRPTPAVGFSMGMERLVLILEATRVTDDLHHLADIYLITSGDKAKQKGTELAEHLRNMFNDKRILTHLGEGGFKSQFKKADKSGASIAIIIGEDELANRQLSIKYLREDKPQDTIEFDQIDQFMASFFGKI